MVTSRKKGRSHNEVNLIEMATMSVNSLSTASVNEGHERKNRPSSIEVSLSVVETSENRLGVRLSVIGRVVNLAGEDGTTVASEGPWVSEDGT
jgi:hypothetical protein